MLVKPPDLAYAGTSFDDPVEEGVDEWADVLVAGKLSLGGRQLPKRIIGRVSTII